MMVRDLKFHPHSFSLSGANSLEDRSLLAPCWQKWRERMLEYWRCNPAWVQAAAWKPFVEVEVGIVQRNRSLEAICRGQGWSRSINHRSVTLEIVVNIVIAIYCLWFKRSTFTAEEKRKLLQGAVCVGKGGAWAEHGLWAVSKLRSTPHPISTSSLDLTP